MRVIEQKLYDFPAGGFCGVMMPKSVMVKVAKVQAKYARELRELLEDNKHKLFASDWTLANTKDENGNIVSQTTIHYVEDNEGSADRLQMRIKLFKPVAPRDVGEVYVARDREHAEEIAQEVHDASD